VHKQRKSMRLSIHRRVATLSKKHCVRSRGHTAGLHATAAALAKGPLRLR